MGYGPRGYGPHPYGGYHTSFHQAPAYGGYHDDYNHRGYYYFSDELEGTGGTAALTFGLLLLAFVGLMAQVAPRRPYLL